jgi:PAS domain S-box-containing protein
MCFIYITKIQFSIHIYGATEITMMSRSVFSNAGKRKFLLFVAFIGFALCSCFSGWLVYKQWEKNAIRERQRELLSIADLKVKQIAQWRSDNLSYGNRVGGNPLLGDEILLFRANPRNVKLRDNLTTWILLQKHYNGFKHVYVCDTAGAVLLADTNAAYVPIHISRESFHAIVAQKKAQLTELHHGELYSDIHLSLIVPIITKSGSREDITAVAIFVIDPQQFLFPLIQSWPVPSKTSESLLIMRRGDSIVFANELRHRKNTALNLTFPLTNKTLPAVMAELGKTGIFEGRDYRNVPVLSALAHVPNSPWYLVAKVDKSEIFGTIHSAALLTLMIVLLFIILAGSLIVGYWHRYSKRMYRELYEKELNEKRVAEELNRTENKYRRLFENSNDAIFVFTINPDNTFNTFIDCNFIATEWLGYVRSELLQKTPHDIIAPEAKDSMYERDKQLIADGRFTCETLMRSKSGQRIPVEISAHVFDNEGVPTVFSITRNITERKNLIAELESEREQLAVTLRSIGDAVISTDVYGKIMLMNRVAENLTGWSLAEARGKPLPEVFTIINEITRQSCENPVEKVLRVGTIITLANHTLLIARNGKEYVIEDSAAPIKDRQSKTVGVVLVFRDYTQKRQKDEYTIKSQKLESIGTLAAGIAHDFNNLLFGIFGYLDILHEQCVDNTTALQTISKVFTVYQRAQALTRQLLTFSKGSIINKVPLALSPVIRKTVEFALSGSTIQPSIHCTPDLWTCYADESQMEQVIDNIIINARQAMPQGGTLDVTADNVVLENNMVHALKAGSYVRIKIRDSGSGISVLHLSKIFDPFFTTKAQGSGLGLAVCYSIMKKHDGHIDVQSTFGKGTEFTLYIPAFNHGNTAHADTQTNAASKLCNKADGNPVTSCGSILVMDDEDFIRDLLQTMLVVKGYHVETVAEGKEAIALVKERMSENEPFDAYILDLTIPGGMGGQETVRLLREMIPNLKAIASSGYSDDPVMNAPREYGFVESIRKPYLNAELDAVLSRVLG